MLTYWWDDKYEVMVSKLGNVDETAVNFVNSQYFILDSFSFSLFDLNQFAIVSRGLAATWIHIHTFIHSQDMLNNGQAAQRVPVGQAMAQLLKMVKSQNSNIKKNPPFCIIFEHNLIVSFHQS